MINGDNITKYTAKNKIYIPQELYNTNYTYTMDNDTITIITRSNCYQNYNSTYCDCIKYNIKYNIRMETYSCNTNTTNNIVAISQLSTDINDSNKITNDFIKDYGIYIGMLIIALLLTGIFKRNSRRL